MVSGEATSENAILTRYARAVDHALRPRWRDTSGR